MTTHPSKPRKVAAKPKLVATFTDAPNKEEAEARARMALLPSVNAAAVAIEYMKPLGEQNIGALVTKLSDDIEALNAGDMQRTEAMLFAQAHALQAIFMNLARRATAQEYLKTWEAYLRMAMKAQNQCRMTLETLAMIKSPPTVFAKQANINHGGQQQVNNGAAPPAPASPARAPARKGAARTRKPKTARTELLEANHAQRLDTRATDKTGGADPHVEAVGAIHRPAHR